MHYCEFHSISFILYTKLFPLSFSFVLFIELSSMKFATFAFVVANVASVSVSSDEKAKAVSLLKQVSHDATLSDLGKALTAGCDSGDWLNLCDRSSGWTHSRRRSRPVRCNGG